MTDRIYFRQLLAGVDVAADDPFANQMRNFVYLIGDRETGEALVVDPAWGVRDIVDTAAADDMRIVGALVTHHHPDHVGGSFSGHGIQGVRELLELVPEAQIHVNRDEAEFVRKQTDIGAGDLVAHDSGDTVTVGEVPIELVHTPGHTPGSQCFLVDRRALVSGDTLFLDGCGRTDLPGGDPAEMYRSLTQRLAKIPDDVVVFPGHLYSPEGSLTLGDTRARNMVFKPKTEEQWLAVFGH